MAKSSEWSKEYSCTPDHLFEVIITPEFHIRRSGLLDNPSAEVKETKRTDTYLEFEVHCVEYAKGVKGIDRSKTENTVTTYRCDLPARRVEWTYEGPQGKRVKVWGDMSVAETSGGARVTQHFNCDVKIPLVGGQIEKLVMKETDKFWPKYGVLMDEFVG